MKRNAILLAKEVLSSRRKRADGGTDEWQSTGKLINDDESINWGNPEVASDFFRADKEDLRRRKDSERDVGGSDVPPSPPRVSEGRQMAEPRVSPPKQEVADGDAPPEPDTFRMPMQKVPVMAGATPPLSSDLDRGPMPPAMQAVANRYSPRDYQEALTDDQRKALALEQWKAAGRSGTPDNPNPAPPPAAAPAPIVQASLTTPAPQQTATDANRQPLRFAPMPGAEPPAPAAAPTSAILAAIRANESRNKPTAQNPRSSAGGLYQFLDSTWGSVLRRMDPQQYGRYNDRQLRSLKTDPRYTDLQHSAADFLLTKDIAPRLEKAGIPLTPGSAYLSWFQGPAGAVKTYTAPDNATVRQVFPKTISANSNMRFNGKSYADWTMSDLRQWADTKMAQRMQPARQPLRFGPAEGYEEGGRVGYADKGAVRDPDDPRQWLEFGGQEMDRAPAGLPIGQAVGTSTAGHIGAQLADATELAHQAATNQLPPDYFHTDEGIERAFNAATAPMTGSFALAPVVGPTVKSGETALSMFVPVLRDDPALAAAKEMLAKGKSKAEIWRETGMHPGPESHFGSYELESKVPDQYGRYQRVGEMPENPEPRWFQEISDEGLKLNRTPEKDTLIWPNSGINLKNEVYSVEHPELQAHFPEFEQVHKSVDVNPVHQTGGFYASSGEYAPGKYGKHMQINAETPEDARKVAAHELQHFVADVGGLEQGNTPTNPAIQDFHQHLIQQSKETYNSINEEFKKFVEESYKDALEKFKIRPNSMQALELRTKVQEEARNIYRETEPEKVNALERSAYILDHIREPYDLYQHIYGEALARATEERLNMTPGERRANPPEFNYHTYNPSNPYKSIPEQNLFSEKDLMDFITNRARSRAAGGRIGYANTGAVEDEAVYSPMGDVFVPPQAPEGAKESLYDRAMQSIRPPEDSRIWEGMKRGFGDQPLGWADRPQDAEFRKEHPSIGAAWDAISKPASAVMRAPGAIIGGLAGAGASAYEAMGAPGGDERLSPEARTNRLERDLFALGNVGALEAGNVRPKAPTYTDAIPRGGDVLPPLPREALAAPERAAPTTIEGNPAALEAPRKALPAPTVVEAAMEKIPEIAPLPAEPAVAPTAPVSVPSQPEAPARTLSDMGFYSRAVEIAQQHLPNKGTPEQMVSTLLNKGASPEELKWAGLLDKDKKIDNSWAANPKVTKDDVLNQLEMVPVMSETVLQGSDIRFPGSSYNIMGGGNYREIILQQDANTPQFEYSDHFPGIYNPTGHMRIHDREDPKLGNGLHSDEFQSDWANEGRKNGFRDPEAEFKIYVQKNAVEEAKAALQKQVDMVSELNPGMSINQIYGQSSVRPLVEEYKDARSELRDLENIFEKQAPHGSHVTNSEDVNKLLARRFLIEAAREGKDFASFTPGHMQEERWGDEKLNDTYKSFTSDFKKVLKEFDPTLKLDNHPMQHQKTASFNFEAVENLANNYLRPRIGRVPTTTEIWDWWNDLDQESKTVYSNNWKKENSGSTTDLFPVVRLNEQQRANILKGGREYKRGGAVDRAMNISRFGTDAVQKAVNLARQHRGRPENPRSTS